MSLVIAQTYFYVYTNFCPFIWIFMWNVSFLPVWPLKFSEFNLVRYEIREFSPARQTKSAKVHLGNRF